jgi:DNA-binding response OmpR family regulator
MARVLVVDDEATLVDTIRYNLRREGYDVHVASEGNEALKLARASSPDLVVLDLMLPGVDGLEVCRQLRRESTVPILMLTAKDDEVDKIVGLEVGADDYMTKPFSPRELVARVQAILRRVDERAAADESTADEVLHVGPVAIDLVTRRVRRDGELVHLTPTEFDLLACLAARPGAVFTREQLLREVWGYRDGSGARTVDSHVRALRRKLGPGVIRTVHAVGYAVEDGAGG